MKKHFGLILGLLILIPQSGSADTIYKSGLTKEISCSRLNRVINLNKVGDAKDTFFTGKGEVRLFTEKNDLIWFDTRNFVLIEGNEEKRKSRIHEDFSVIVETAFDIKKDAITGFVQDEHCVSYSQKYKLSTLEVTAKKQNNESKKETFILGPKERFYLSADMPVNDIEQLTYDQTTSQVIEKEVPSSFYLGFNIKVGDVFIDYETLDVNNIALKVMFDVSKPSSSYGIGLAYDFDIMDVFVGYVWTKDDDSVPAAKLDETGSAIVGISFNLSRAADWLK